jgi:hypothetical protein
MQRVLAQFLSARDILTCSHTCARLRANTEVIISRELSSRFPGRTRAGAHETPEIRAALPDWKFALMLENRKGRAGHYIILCGDIHGSLEEREQRELKQFEQNAHSYSWLLRGDVIQCTYCGAHYWSGLKLCKYEVIDNTPCVPSEFSIPIEFPADYFAGAGKITHFAFNVARYREQILDSLIIREYAHRPVYKFHFAEGNRKFWFNVHHHKNPRHDCIDFQTCDTIALMIISYIRQSCEKTIWILETSRGIHSS